MSDAAAAAAAAAQDFHHYRVAQACLNVSHLAVSVYASICAPVYVSVCVRKRRPIAGMCVYVLICLRVFAVCVQCVVCVCVSRHFCVSVCMCVCWRLRLLSDAAIEVKPANIRGNGGGGRYVTYEMVAIE